MQLKDHELIKRLNLTPLVEYVENDNFEKQVLIAKDDRCVYVFSQYRKDGGINVKVNLLSKVFGQLKE